MGGFPPDENYSDFAVQNHQAWGISGEEAIRMRRAEDRAACEVLGAQPQHFQLPDAIYRRDHQSGKPVVKDNETLFSAKPEKPIVDEIAKMLQEELPEEAKVVCPMGLGNHIDHRAVFLAAREVGATSLYYADYPYILNHFNAVNFIGVGWEKLPSLLDQNALEAWQTAVLCYGSQWGTFWRDEHEARLVLQNYAAGGGGGLWRKPVS